MSLLLLFSSSPAKYGLAQAQADVKQTYYVHAQAQARIPETLQGYAQAQADISSSLFVRYGLGQTQAQLIGQGWMFGQAQANILATNYALAQTQATIKQIYQSYAQSNTKITGIIFVFAQAQALMLWRFGLAQAQTYIRLPRLITSQAQGYIFVTPVPPRAIIPVTISVNKNGLRNTSRYTIGNAAWEMMLDRKANWWRADFDSEDILIVDKED